MFGFLNKAWGYIAAAAGFLLVVVLAFFKGQSVGKTKEERKQLEAEAKADKKAQETARDAMEAIGTGQGKAQAAKSQAETESERKKKEAKTTGKATGGQWAVFLVAALLLTGCCSTKPVTKYPLIPDLQVQERPVLLPWELPVTDENQEAIDAIITNEARLKGQVKAYEEIIRAYRDFRVKYMKAADNLEESDANE